MNLTEGILRQQLEAERLRPRYVYIHVGDGFIHDVRISTDLNELTEMAKRTVESDFDPHVDYANVYNAFNEMVFYGTDYWRDINREPEQTPNEGIREMPALRPF